MNEEARCRRNPQPKLRIALAERCLDIRLLMAFRAFRRSFFPSGGLFLVAIDADARGRSGIVKCGLKLSLHRRGCRLRVAIRARLGRRFRRLFRLGGVVARGACLVMLRVQELHSAHRRAL